VNQLVSIGLFAIGVLLFARAARTGAASPGSEPPVVAAPESS
jgi:hypothetical protein